MAKVSMSDAISLTAQYAGYSQEVTREIVDAYTHIIFKLLLKGLELRIRTLGRFYLTTQPAQAEREWKSPLTGKVEKLSAKPAYQRPYFKFYPSVVKEIREVTEGHLL